MLRARIWLEDLEHESVELAEEDDLTFGRHPRPVGPLARRHARLVVDPDNRRLHRDLGRVSFRAGSWWLTNLGSRMVLQVSSADGDTSVPLAPEGTTTLPIGRSSLDFEAGETRYRLWVGITTGEAPANEPAPTLQMTTLPPDDGWGAHSAVAPNRSGRWPGRQRS